MLKAEAATKVADNSGKRTAIESLSTERETHLIKARPIA